MWDCIAGIAATGGLGIAQPAQRPQRIALPRWAGSQPPDPCNKVSYRPNLTATRRMEWPSFPNRRLGFAIPIRNKAYELNVPGVPLARSLAIKRPQRNQPGFALKE